MKSEILSTLLATFNSVVNIKGSRYSVTKADIINGASEIFDNIETTLLPTLDQITTSYVDEINKEKKYLPVLKTEFEKRFKDSLKSVDASARGHNIVVFEIMKVIFQNLSDNRDHILNTFNNNLQLFVGSETANIKDMSIISYIDNINYAMNVAMDFMLYSVFEVVGEANELGNRVRDRAMSSAGTLVNSLVKLEEPRLKEYLKDLPKISTIDMNAVENATPDDVYTAANDAKEKMPEYVLDNFVGNPIYHVRLWIADYKHNKYKQNLLKKDIILGKVNAIRSGSVETYKKQSVVIDKLLADLAEVEKQIVDYQKSVLD